MKKLFVFLFVLIAIFAFASCKQDPKNEEPAPAPAPEASGTDEDVLAGNAYYRLTATREAKRFALQYLDEEGGTFDPAEDDVLTFKYRTNHAVDRIYLRDSSQNAIYPDTSSYHAIQESEDPYVTGPDADGWYTFSFTFGEMTDPRFGFRLELACYSTELGKFQPKDYIDIKDLEYKGEKLTIEAADEDNEYQSNQGVWNASNTDHTLPTLSIIKTN